MNFNYNVKGFKGKEWSALALSSGTARAMMSGPPRMAGLGLKRRFKLRHGCREDERISECSSAW